MTRISMFLMGWAMVAPWGSCAAQPAAEERDCASIQRRIDALPASGGVVRLGAGTWVCHEPIVIRKNNVELRGSERTTHIVVAEGANSPAIVIGSDAPMPEHLVQGVTVSGLQIDGQRGSQRFECFQGPCSASNPLRNNGVTIRRASDVKVEDVTVARAASGGLVSELGTVRLSVRSFTAFDSKFDGLAAYETTDSVYSNIFVHDNLAAGVSVDIKFRGNQLIGVVAANNAKVGLFIRDATDNVFSGLVVRGSGEHGVFAAQVDSDASLPAASNTFTGVIISQSKGAAIRINDASCVNNVLSGAVLRGNAACVSEAVPGLLKSTAVVCQ